MHDAAPRQPVEPRPQEPREVRVRGARVQEEGQADFDGHVELRGEVLQLGFLRAERQAVVVQADLAEGDDWGAGLRVCLGEAAEGGEHGGGA